MTTDRDPNSYHTSHHAYVHETRGSNTFAYVISGLVVALGLLAFLFYDGGSRDVSTTGSVTAPHTQSTPAMPSMRPVEPAPLDPARPGAPTAAPLQQ